MKERKTWQCSHYTRFLFVAYPVLKERTATAPGGTSRSHTSNIVPERLAKSDGVGVVSGVEKALVT